MRTTNSIDTRNPARERTMRAALTGIVAAGMVALAMLAAIALPAITRPSATLLLGGVAALFALTALASLVHLVVTDMRQSLSRVRSQT